MTESTLDRARAGDAQAFQELIAPHVRELRLHCYRMLGSLTDADDVVQESLVAAWAGLAGFQQRASLRTWLYRITTNRCLNWIRAARRRIPEEPVPPFRPPEPTRRRGVRWLQPCPHDLIENVVEPGPGPDVRFVSRETVELAFIAALQALPPRQAATLVLRDVLGFSGEEVAAMLGTTATAIKGALQRARRSLDRRGRDGSEAAPAPGSPVELDVARRFAEAFTGDDVDEVIGLLTDDAWLAMPPAPHEYQGASAIAAFLRASATWRGTRRVQLVSTRANTQPAFGCYLADSPGENAQPIGLVVLTLRADCVRAITRFLDADLPRRFGLHPPAP